MYYFYTLQNKNGKYYYGSTDNLKRRINDHNNNKVISTCHKGPWKVIYFEKYKTLKEAIKREYQVKTKKRKNYVEWLIKNKKPSAEP